VDFEHGLNKSVQKLRDALGDSADSPLYIETIPRVGYRFLAPVSAGARPFAEKDSRVALNGGPAAAVSAEAREAAPVTSVPQHGRKLPSVASAGLVIALTALSVWLIVRPPRRGSPIHSLAMLPLDNLSGDAGQEYFADGMTDELTTMLAKDSTLRIVSRTSVMQYKGVHRPLPQIARELGVEGIVEGSVERSGDKVHMTLQLIQGPTDTHVWAESYDRNANDLVSLPDEAAVAIAKKTNSAVLHRSPARYVNPEAHDAYLHGHYLWFAGRNDEAWGYFRKAVDLQPDYALAWTGVAEYWGAGIVEGHLDPRKASKPLEVAADKAVELDDSLPQAHLVLCAAIFFVEWDGARADRECQRAIDLDPKFAEAYHFRAKILSATNRHEEAIEEQKKASELDPFARPWALAYMYLLARHYDAALVEARQRLESDPHNALLLYMVAWSYRCKGMKAEAAKATEDGLIAEGKQADAASVRRAFEQGGYHAALLSNIADLKRQSEKQYLSPVYLALQYAQLGEREETLNLLEEAYRQHSPMLLEDVQDDPAYDFLHSDERYRSIIKKVGVPPEW
jgi:TolB-like protein